MAKLDIRSCDRCGVQFPFDIGVIHVITAENKKSLLATVYDPVYDSYEMQKELDLCPSCSEAFKAFLEETKPDPMDDLENWLDDEPDEFDPFSDILCK